MLPPRAGLGRASASSGGPNRSPRWSLASASWPPSGSRQIGEKRRLLRDAGPGGRVFRIWKFRTMCHNASDPGGRRLTLRNDPRVTRVGAFLRRTSLDELPQLLNVLTGEMSLVGPRPHPLEAVAGGRAYAEVVPDIARRLRVKPGMTGLAQVEGWRGNTDTERKLVERVRADLRYIDNWSFWLDIEILFRTPLASLLTEEAY
ncbi:MAG: sugar transferase [Geminicoccaceae bacterium]|nr:sugar transferase [Geminicoccaceae bacterium]MDW8370070.1 sugar transferase [Geminicoccaceae bacterium]